LIKKKNFLDIKKLVLFRLVKALKCFNTAQMSVYDPWPRFKSILVLLMTSLKSNVTGCRHVETSYSIFGYLSCVYIIDALVVGVVLVVLYYVLVQGQSQD
jgi:hypothetical protein